MLGAAGFLFQLSKNRGKFCKPPLKSPVVAFNLRDGVSPAPTIRLKVVFTALGIHDVSLAMLAPLGIVLPPGGVAADTIWICGTGSNRGCDALKGIGVSGNGSGFGADPIAALVGNDGPAKGGTGTFAPSIVVDGGVVLGLTT